MTIPEQCRTSRKDAKIVLEENRSGITFLNKAHKNITVIRVDGCAITKGARCDYLVLDERRKEHFVELKGSRLARAVTQIETSIEKLSDGARRQDKFCFIVSARCPLLTPEIQELKIRFKKRYNATLIIKNRYYAHAL